MAASDIITIDDAHDHLNMTASSEDPELAGYITAASSQVEQVIGPVIIREFVDRERYGPRVALDRCPVVGLVSVLPTFTTGSALDVAGLVVNPERGTVRLGSGAWLPGGPWDVTYTAGRADSVNTVPEAVALACAVIVKHLWETQRAATFGPQSGDFGMPAQGAGFAMPYRARDLLAPWRSQVIV